MKTKRKILGVIPARLAASRFPNKPLKKITHLHWLGDNTISIWPTPASDKTDSI